MKTKETIKHQLYKTGDQDAPEIIKDQNGEVILDLCKACGKGESDLSDPCKSARELALEWWKSLSSNQRKVFGFKYFDSDKNTNEEIEEIWKKEIQEDHQEHSSVLEHRKNQKQFKEFNPELFKAYINKFSDEDKVKAVKILLFELQDMCIGYIYVGNEWLPAINETTVFEIHKSFGFSTHYLNSTFEFRRFPNNYTLTDFINKPIEFTKWCEKKLVI